MKMNVKEMAGAAAYVILVGLTCYLAGAFFQWLLGWHEVTPAVAMMATGAALALRRVLDDVDDE